MCYPFTRIVLCNHWQVTGLDLLGIVILPLSDTYAWLSCRVMVAAHCRSYSCLKDLLLTIASTQSGPARALLDGAAGAGARAPEAPRTAAAEALSKGAAARTHTGTERAAAAWAGNT